MTLRVLLISAMLLVSAPLQAQNAQARAVLAQQRADAALRVLTHAIASYSSGLVGVDEVGTWAERWYQARRDTGLTGAALATAAQEWADKMRAFVTTTTTRVQAGIAQSSDADKALYYKLEAETEYARVKTP
jgi:hypothetical protein